MNDAITKALADELEKMRQSRSASQENVAEWLHISRSTIANYEQGRRDIPLDVFFKYCDVCYTDPYVVLERVRKFVYKK